MSEMTRGECPLYLDSGLSTKQNSDLSIFFKKTHHLRAHALCVLLSSSSNPPSLALGPHRRSPAGGGSLISGLAAVGSGGVRFAKVSTVRHALSNSFVSCRRCVVTEHPKQANIKNGGFYFERTGQTWIDNVRPECRNYQLGISSGWNCLRRCTP
jgi:hypothetical protein